MESLDKSLWSIKSIWRVGWRLPLSRRIVRNSKGELYLSDCKWLHFHCNLCISFYPVLPYFPIPHCIFKGLPYSRVPRTRAWGVLRVRIGQRYKVHHARVSCIVKSGPLNAQHFDEVSATVIEWVWTSETSSFFCFPAAISTVITISLEGVSGSDSVFFFKCERIVLGTNKLLRFYLLVSL